VRAGRRRQGHRGGDAPAVAGTIPSGSGKRRGPGTGSSKMPRWGSARFESRQIMPARREKICRRARARTASSLAPRRAAAAFAVRDENGCFPTYRAAGIASYWEFGSGKRQPSGRALITVARLFHSLGVSTKTPAARSPSNLYSTMAVSRHHLASPNNMSNQRESSKPPRPREAETQAHTPTDGRC